MLKSVGLLRGLEFMSLLKDSQNLCRMGLIDKSKFKASISPKNKLNLFQVKNMFKVSDKNTRATSVLVFFLLTLNIFHAFFWCFYC